MSFNLKTATPTTSFTGGFLFGAASQSDSNPSVITSAAIKEWLGSGTLAFDNVSKIISSDGDNAGDSIPFNFTHNNYVWSSPVTYNDDVFAWGFNISSPNTKINASENAGWWSFERKFWINDRYYAEYHLSNNGTNNSETRLLSFVASHDGAKASGSSTVDSFHLLNMSGQAKFSFNLAANTLYLMNSTSISGSTNNSSIIRGADTGGSYLNLLKVNASNQAEMGCPFYIISSSTAKPVAYFQYSGTSANSIIETAGATTGGETLTVLNAVNNTSGELKINLQNNGVNGSTNTPTTLTLYNLRGHASNDVKITFTNHGYRPAGEGGSVSTVDYSIGLDKTDDKWKICGSTSLGTSEIMCFNDSLQIECKKPITLNSYTVATVPTIGVNTYLGGLIYVSDESGGAVVAFSDGSNWRRVTDRAIIS